MDRRSPGNIKAALTASFRARRAALAGAFVFLYPIAAAASAGTAAPTDNGRDVPPTVWDRIMEEQGRRNLREGYLLMEAERYAEASAEFTKAIDRAPRDPYAHILYGASLYWLGEPDKAMSEFEAALALDPRNSMAYQLMGIVHSWKGEFRPALENFLKALSLDPERADIRMNAGSVYSALGEMDKSLEQLRQAARFDRDNPLYAYQLGLLYGRLGRFSEAAEEFKRALSLYGDYEDAMLELAVVEEKAGRDKEALRLYRRALALKPGDNVVRFRLACLLLRTGDLKRLDGLLEEAFLLTPSNDKGGISISLAYAGGQPSGDDDRPAAGQGSLETAISKVPQDEDISVKIEFISVPRPKLTAKPEAKPGKLGAGLEAGFKKTDAKYMRREYSLPASDIARRGTRAAQIASEMNEALKAASSQGMDTRMSVSIETKKASLSPGGSRAGVVYKPRDVGNDMGLWVMGTIWVESVEDALDDLQDLPGPARTAEQRLTRGLGRLILGEPDAALAEFDAAPGRTASDLGRCAALVEKGSQEQALEACLKALEKDPRNRTALANKKWLTAGPGDHAGKVPAGAAR